MGWKKDTRDYLDAQGDWHFPTFTPGGRMGGKRQDMRRWRTVPIKWVFRGNRHAAFAFMRQAEAMMGMLEQQMAFLNLRQGVLRRFVNPDVLIECDKRFGLRTVTITARPDMPALARELLRECFANRTVALAYVLDVVGLETTADQNAVQEPAFGLRIVAYPANYYCTRGVRYTVAVCDGKGEYLLFDTKAASSDYTPWRPGDQVLVMQHRTPELPENVLTTASPDPNDNPYGRPPFTRALVKFPEECVSILPWQVKMAKVTEHEIVRG